MGDRGLGAPFARMKRALAKHGRSTSGIAGRQEPPATPPAICRAEHAHCSGSRRLGWLNTGRHEPCRANSAPQGPCGPELGPDRAGRQPGISHGVQHRQGECGQAHVARPGHQQPWRAGRRRPRSDHVAMCPRRCSSRVIPRAANPRPLPVPTLASFGRGPACQRAGQLRSAAGSRPRLRAALCAAPRPTRRPQPATPLPLRRLLPAAPAGIRSFSPDNQNVIEFYKPLTLIVGHNGAGKTVRAGQAAWPVQAAVLPGCM